MADQWQKEMSARYAAMRAEERAREAEGFRMLAARMAVEASLSPYPEVACGLWAAASMAQERAALAEVK